jgi:hypothetical protein
MWLERKRFPALELGIIATTTGVKADDLGVQTKAQLRAEGRVRRQRSQGCSRVSMRRVRRLTEPWLHGVTYQRIGANGVYGAKRSIRHDSPCRV